MATHSEYGMYTSGKDVAEAFKAQIKDRTVVITGVSPKSLGEALASTIAQHSPAELILVSRTKSKLEAVAEAITRSGSSIKPKLVIVDLASQQSVRNAAIEVQRLVSHIDIVINNAAIVTSDIRYTEEGIETQFGTGHIGHFLFTTLLLPQIKSAAAAAPKGSTRIINVSSAGHRLSPIRFHDYSFEGKHIPPEERPPQDVPDKFLPKADQPYSVFVAYGQSKTANILFSLSLTERLAVEGIKSYAVHPGSIVTDLSRNLNPEDARVIETTASDWVTQDQGIPTILVAAFDPALSLPQHSVYLSDCQISEAAAHARDHDAARRLWDLSEELTRLQKARI